MLNVLAVPLAGLPPVAVHANVYGVVPPETVDVQLTVAPTVTAEGVQFIETVNAPPTVLVTVTLTLLASVTFSRTVNGPVLE